MNIIFVYAVTIMNICFQNLKTTNPVKPFSERKLKSFPLGKPGNVIQMCFACSFH